MRSSGEAAGVTKAEPSGRSKLTYFLDKEAHYLAKEETYECPLENDREIASNPKRNILWLCT